MNTLQIVKEIIGLPFKIAKIGAFGAKSLQIPEFQRGYPMTFEIPKVNN